MGCSSTNSTSIKDYNFENKIKEEKKEIIGIDIFRDEPKPQFEKRPDESQKPNITYDEDDNSSN